MYLVEFFGLKVKPRLTRGKGMWCPDPTQRREDGIVEIRDKDVNMFLIPSENGYVAIDCGYKNSENVRDALRSLCISPECVQAVFLTHLDIDHSGGVDASSANVFPNAVVHLSREEEKYLTGEYFRKRFLGIPCKTPVSLRPGYQVLGEFEQTTVDGVTLTAVPCYGHTLGHYAYLYKDVLFSGDTIISNGEKGFAFYNFWNADSALLAESLLRLRHYCKEHGVRELITSHSGSLPVGKAFEAIDQMVLWKKKGFVFNSAAPFDPYL